MQRIAAALAGLGVRARDRPDLIILAAITALAAIVRFATLGAQSFDSGEAITASRVLHPSYLATLHQVATSERSPPLYYSLAWGWSRLFGTGEVGLRALSAIFGTLTVPFAYLAARELATRRAGLFAAGLFAINPYLFWYSQEARSYALLVMFSTLGIYLFARALTQGGKRALAGWAAVSALALLSHYFAVFLVGPEAIWLLAGRSRSRHTVAAVFAVGAVGLALLPLAVHQERSGRLNAFTRIPVLDRTATTVVKFASGEGPSRIGGLGTTAPIQRVAGAVALALLAAAIALVVSRGLADERQGAARAGTLGAAAFGVPILLAFAGVDYLDPRNLIAALVPILLVAAIGLGVGHGSWVGIPALAASLTCAAALLLATAVDPALQRDDWRGAARLIGRSSAPRVLVADAAAGKSLDYYLGHLAKLAPATFPDGVVTRRVDVLTNGHRVRPLRHGFHLVSSAATPQRWRVDTYEAPRPKEVQAAWVSGTRVLDWRSAALVESPPPTGRAVG